MAQIVVGYMDKVAPDIVTAHCGKLHIRRCFAYARNSSSGWNDMCKVVQSGDAKP